jgi:hypothetical protein
MQSTGNRHLDELIDSIDSTVCNGDALEDINAALVFQIYMHRWQRVMLKNFTPEGQTADFDPTQF